jgi:hypothetical protein
MITGQKRVGWQRGARFRKRSANKRRAQREDSGFA